VSTHLDTATSRPSGRDQVTAALLSATERLCVASQPSTFTVADIAREANTTTSLLYFYFESKDDIVIATLRWIASDLDAMAAGATPSEMATVVSRLLSARPAFVRIISWLILEGRSVTEEMGDHPFLRRLLVSLSADNSDDAHTQAGAVVAVLLSNALFSGDINAAIGRKGDDHQLSDALDGCIAALLNPQL